VLTGRLKSCCVVKPILAFWRVFLSELLFTDITIIEILESKTNKPTSDNKQNRVDIKVRDGHGQLILIEIQYSREQDYLFRMLFETSKSIAEHLDQGRSYADVVNVISVSIAYFDFCQGNDYIYHRPFLHQCALN
jgi:predicted transposase/invertase (TIGR01784 family)